MEERDNILRVLEEAKKAVEERDTTKLRELSNQTNNTVSRTQDPDNVAVAVIIYALSKIIERGYIKTQDVVIKKINDVIRSIKKNDSLLDKNLKQLRVEIEKSSGRMKGYAQDVFRKASINKASKIYEHGVSMENTANLLGITMFELASYAGQKGISDTPESRTLGVKQRIKLATEIFL